MPNITIIDYGMGNIRSIVKALERIHVTVNVSADHDVIANASKLILPGVGHFSNGMKRLQELNLIEILNKKVVSEKIPILGICLGMQLFTSYSEEGDCNGLGWVDARTIKFSINNRIFKIPHMGWNNLIVKKKSVILTGIEDSDTFYFVHSFHVVCSNFIDVLCITNYGMDFTSVFQCDNIIGMQFHPEKSHKAGLQLLKNFCGEG